MIELLRTAIGLLVFVALMWLVLAVVGTAAGWWDPLGLISGRRRDD